MSYNDMPHYEAETFIKNRLDEPLKPIVGRLYGRNAPGYLIDDTIRGFSDLDMLSQLPYSLYGQYERHAANGQSALLQAAKRSIEKTYSITSIRADGQVILAETIC